MGWLGYFSLLVRVSLYSHVYVLIVVYEGIVCTVLDTLVLTEVLANVCRWANFVGGLPKEDFDYVVDLLFDPRKGLGMNITTSVGVPTSHSTPIYDPSETCPVSRAVQTSPTTGQQIRDREPSCLLPVTRVQMSLKLSTILHRIG
jgi:hypothetical protein